MLIAGEFVLVLSYDAKPELAPRRRQQKKAEQAAEEEKEKKNNNNDASRKTSPPNPPVTDVSSSSASADAGTKVPELEKPSVGEQTLTVSESVWNEAYDSIEKEEPQLVKAYMRAITVALQPKGAADAPTPEGPDVSAELNDPIKRQATMKKLVQAGREKVATSSKITQGVGDFADSILKAKGLIDLAVQNIPQAALPWAGVCVGLQILLNPSQASKSNLAGITHVHVVSRMDWYCSLTGHLLSEKCVEVGNESYQSVLAQLRGRVVELYKALLLYQMRNVCSYYRNQGLVFLRGLINMDDWDGELQSVEDAETALQKDSDQYNNQHSKSLLSELVLDGEKSQSYLGDVRQALGQYIALQKDARMDDKHSECIRRLRVVDPEEEMLAIESNKDKLLKEAYQWTIHTQEYAAVTNWADEGQCRMLWVKGPAGTGKTMLLIGIIRELTDQPFKLAPNLSYFLCQASNRELNNATAILRSLVWMLLVQQPHLISHLLEKYNTSGAALFNDGKTFCALSGVFKKMLADPQLSSVYLIVDALDECDQNAPGMKHLIDLVSESLAATKKVKWIISSRPEVRLHEHLKSHATGTLVEIDVKGQEGPVNAYIDHKLSDLRVRDGYTDEILDQISLEIRQRANNTFLWVALVFRELALAEVWEALDVVKSKPSGLSKLYDDMMSKVEREQGKTLQYCKSVLVATCLAYRPLSFSELTMLAGLPPAMPMEQLVRKCGSFLTIKDNTVNLIHLSAREYLEENYNSRLQQAGATQGHAMGRISFCIPPITKLQTGLSQTTLLFLETHLVK